MDEALGFKLAETKTGNRSNGLGIPNIDTRVREGSHTGRVVLGGEEEVSGLATFCGFLLKL